MTNISRRPTPRSSNHRHPQSRHALRKAAGLLLLSLCVAPEASALDIGKIDKNVLVGFGWVGPAQYDQGYMKPMMTVNATGMIRIGEVHIGGVGLAVRATEGGVRRLFAHKNFDELGLAVPVVTARLLGRSVVQAGVEIQRSNLQKNFYYFAIGAAFGGRPRLEKPRAARLAPALIPRTYHTSDDRTHDPLVYLACQNDFNFESGGDYEGRARRFPE
jgi:hypothetical protein